MIEHPHRIVGVAGLRDRYVFAVLTQQCGYAIAQNRMIVDDENLHENPRCRREEKLPVERGPTLRAMPGWLVVVAFRRAILQAIVRVQRACFAGVDRCGDIVFTLPHESPRLTRAGNQSPAIVAAWWRPGAGQIRCADNQSESRRWADRRTAESGEFELQFGADAEDS
ncbi:hypothetical protein [Burkholderia vietnamiensis]|uniref:hypothetical protein n=1 Tax=Burkholderia vietnamiensis TaxID=60552 RepID=UPI001E4867DE|nr:hypothetical protein [Burkholderia vietnamiensis]